MRFKAGDRIKHQELGLGTVVDRDNLPLPFTGKVAPPNDEWTTLILLDNGHCDAYPPYWWASNSYITLVQETEISEKSSSKPKLTGTSHCPLCGSLGHDLVFDFYCSNINCVNYKK